MSLSFFYSVAFHRPLYIIFHGAFQKMSERYNKCIAAGGDYFLFSYTLILLVLFFLSFRVHLQIVSFSLVVQRSVEEPFSGGLFNLPYEQAWGRPFTLYIKYKSVCFGISRPTCLIFPLCRFDFRACLVSCGFRGQSAFSLQTGRSLFAISYTHIRKPWTSISQHEPLTWIQFFRFPNFCWFARETREREGGSL